MKSSIMVISTLKRTILFVQLEQLNIDIPSDLRFYPYFAVFDIECLLVDSDKPLFDKVHVPVSILANSNVPNFNSTVCFHLFSEGGVKDLVQRFLDYSNHLSERAYEIVKELLPVYVDRIQKERARLRKLELATLEEQTLSDSVDPSDPVSISENIFKILGSHLNKRMRQLP